MTAVADLIDRLRSIGWEFAVAGERLVYDAPEYDGFAADLDAVRANRDELVALLTDKAWEAWDRLVAETVANVAAAPPADKRGWHREVVAALRWIDAGQPDDDQCRTDAAFDAEVLHRLLGPGRCLACGNATTGGGTLWCRACAIGCAAGGDAGRRMSLARSQPGSGGR